MPPVEVDVEHDHGAGGEASQQEPAMECVRKGNKKFDLTKLLNGETLKWTLLVIINTSAKSQK